MKKRVAIIGSGLIGKTIAKDLCNNHIVTCIDLNYEILKEIKKKLSVNTIQLDVTDKKTFSNQIQQFDIVICAVPGHLGFETLKTIIENKRNVVDISFFPENPFLLDDLAKKNKVTAVVDCGVAPGLCNIIAGYHNTKTPLTSYECLVGGLPATRTFPFEYKAGFSPIDVIEEYTRPARLVVNGMLIEREALSDIEMVDIAPVGTLESFNTDGLRTLLQTMPEVKNMKEKTLRYPGHAEKMKIFKASGFFEKSETQIGKVKISPLKFTSSLLFPKWKLSKDELEYTIMKVKLENKKQIIEYSLFDATDFTNENSSMARTTGFTCTSIATQLLNNKIKDRGIIAPEFLGKDDKIFKSIMQYLNKRQINIEVKTSKKNSNGK